jgi:predicted alpha/beta superfamily hydrolase
VASPYPLSDGTGVLSRHPDFPSRHVASRHVDVWLPPDYGSRPEIRYPVIYMHDGQNLFDPALSFIGVDWGMDEVMLRLIQVSDWPGAIIVGVWNTPWRRREYMPDELSATPPERGMLARFIQDAGGPPLSRNYLGFLAEELKPFIDAHYRTRPDPPNTLIMGSSMGGLISLYAIIEYPAVFGGAGCLSTHWPIGEEPLVDALGARLPNAGRHRLYFDYGTETLDAAYEPYQQRMDEWLRAAGYQADRDWLTCKFQGAEHSERAWRSRAHIPVSFLLKLLYSTSE